MKRLGLSFLLLATTVALAATKPKVVTFVRWMTVKWSATGGEETAEMRVRPLLVNGDVKEYTAGEPHMVTERTFVVQRAVRLNDSLPGDGGDKQKWAWQPGGWLLVQRGNAHIAKLSLPEFDAAYSDVSWYRDLAAYCGVSDGGEKLYAIVVQIGQHKPVLKKAIAPAQPASTPAVQCAEPVWQRGPTRVTFAPAGADKVTFSVRGRAVELAIEAPTEGEEQ